MKKLRLSKFEPMIQAQCSGSIILGYISEIGVDMHGVKYEIMRDSRKYINLPEELDNWYLSEDLILEMLMASKIRTITDGAIFEHGYPEARLIPSNHYRECVDSFIADVKESLNKDVERILLDAYNTEMSEMWEE